jgi:hypothetical protein
VLPNDCEVKYAEKEDGKEETRKKADDQKSAG